MTESGCISVRGLSKAFGGLQVLDHMDAELRYGHTYCLMGASGSGKTTFLRILLGLEQADGGTVTDHTAGPKALPLVAVFQENRLCESFSALENIMLVTGKSLTRDEIYKEACRLLPEESVSRPVCSLSGGMKRRVAILRALLAPSRGILMDEPFTGLDEENRKLVIAYIREKSAGKLLVVATHQEEDVAALDGIPITI